LCCVRYRFGQFERRPEIKSSNSSITRAIVRIGAGCQVSSDQVPRPVAENVNNLRLAKVFIAIRRRASPPGQGTIHQARANSCRVQAALHFAYARYVHNVPGTAQFPRGIADHGRCVQCTIRGHPADVQSDLAGAQESKLVRLVRSPARSAAFW